MKRKKQKITRKEATNLFIFIYTSLIALFAFLAFNMSFVHAGTWGFEKYYFCGDGIQTSPNSNGEIEECDYGDENMMVLCTGPSGECNNDYEECTSRCTRTFCGDAVTQTPNFYNRNEECDYGDSAVLGECYCNGPNGICDCNNDAGTCNVNCNKTYCGDGIIQNPDGYDIEEICDQEKDNSANGWPGFVNGLCNKPGAPNQCDCIEHAHYDINSGKCSCDPCYEYHSDSETCEFLPHVTGEGNEGYCPCENTFIWSVNTCVCRANSHYNPNTDTCDCDDGYEEKNGTCMKIEIEYKIKEVKLSVPWDYKHGHYLDERIDIDGMGFYEKEGLNELINTDEKCLNCGSDEEKAKIKGIITEYDKLQVDVIIKNGTYDLNNYKVRIRIVGASLPDREVFLNTCNFSKQKKEYTCTANFEGGLVRGTRIRAKSELIKLTETIQTNYSWDFVVAAFNFLTFPLSSPTSWMNFQYKGFVEISDLNKKTVYAGKPVYIGNDETPLLKSDFDCIGFYENRLDIFSGFDNNNDVVLVYSDSILKWATKGVAEAKGLKEIGGQCHCKIPYSSFSKLFSFWLLDFFNLYDLNADMDSTKIIFMPETPLNWLQTKYVLSHELGHLYGRYNEEYNWAAWYYQTYGLTLKGITFKGSGLKNAENEFGNIDFPICCKKYVCCADKYSNVGPPIDIRWEPIFKCPNSQSKKFPITIQLEDSLCSNKPKPKDAYSLNAVGCGKTNSEWLICSGTPYIDSRGMQPNVELLSSEPSPNYYSVMGSPIFDLDRVYPEPSVCPLKCPD